MVLSVLRLTASDYPFGIYKLFLSIRRIYVVVFSQRKLRDHFILYLKISYKLKTKIIDLMFDSQYSPFYLAFFVFVFCHSFDLKLFVQFLLP